MNMVYAALFRPEDDGGFSISFPDLDGCFSEGDDLAHAIEMATEVLGLFLSTLMDREIDFKPPTPIGQLDPENGFLTYISVDPTPFREKK
ncbi:MAG: type II toxin-antitoxin system HicB family antitoxin [Clostridiales bacterium]|nr:type II toxin-antitoxin system HicB family antitoxin [Clostridiales bacterium]